MMANYLLLDEAAMASNLADEVLLSQASAIPTTYRLTTRPRTTIESGRFLEVYDAYMLHQAMKRGFLREGISKRQNNRRPTDVCAELAAAGHNGLGRCKWSEATPSIGYTHDLLVCH